MCIDMYIDMGIHICMHVDMCIGMSVDIRADMCIDMCIFFPRLASPKHGRLTCWNSYTHGYKLGQGQVA